SGPLWEYLGGLDPLGARRSEAIGPDPSGQPDRAGDLRRRLHVGGGGDRVVGAACLFPGQGSQSVGMGRALAERYPEAKAVFAEADKVLGFALSTLCFEGPAEELTRTENTQPALLATSVAAFRVLEARGLKPAAAAGHSAGEYAAYVEAGSLTLTEVLTTIRWRGEAMAGAGKERPGTMAAVLGL